MSITYREHLATYGSQQTETTIYVAEDCRGQQWYVCDGSVNVNATFDVVRNGVWIEELSDHDCFTAGEPIESIEDLRAAIED